MRRLYQPINSTFVSHYVRDLQPIYQQKALETATSETAVSRWSSMAAALGMVTAAEHTRGNAYAYDFVYVTRPDVLLWKDVDLRRYCANAVYQSNCKPPFFHRTQWWNSDDEGCPSDFHFVMTSAMARKFSTAVDHLSQYYFQNEENNEYARFVRDVVGVPLAQDHVVIGRHEELLRKDPHGEMEAMWKRCCCTNATVGPLC